MEATIKNQLGLTLLKPTGKTGGGCINQGEQYLTNKGHIFVKKNTKQGSLVMFEGEKCGLEAIDKTATVCVPKPLLVVDCGHSGCALVMEHLELKGLSTGARILGEDLARLHKHNLERVIDESSIHKQEDVVKEFGFHVNTCCGFLPLDNTWNKDWVEFFTLQRLQHQINLMEEKYGDRTALELWSKLQLKIPSFFADVIIHPSLLHGDLWGGNAGQVGDKPVIFDPAAFYGHYEFEMGIVNMFGGFDKSFFDGYYSLLPKEKGYKDRLSLYQLFHYLNHWNHFGGSYRGSSINVMKSLLK